MKPVVSYNLRFHDIVLTLLQIAKRNKYGAVLIILSNYVINYNRHGDTSSNS